MDMSKDPSTPRTGWKSNNSTPKSTSKWARLQDKLHQYSNSSSSPFHISRSSSHSTHDLSVNTSTTPLLYQDSPYSARTTSIPRNILTPSSAASASAASASTSTSRSDLRTVSGTPPKVEPFLHNSNTPPPPRPRKTLINLHCCFCEELMSSRLASEKIIELTCGEVCHEECLFLLLDSDPKSNEPYSIFPQCETCHKQAIPSDESITSSIVSRFLISTPPPPPPPRPTNLSRSQPTSTDSLIISSNYQLPSHPNPPRLGSPLSTPQMSSSQTSFDTLPHSHNKYQSMTLSKKNSKDLSIQIPERTFSKSHSHHRHRSRTSKSRGSSISAISSIVSSVPKSPSPTLSNFTVSLKDPSKVTLALSRSQFMSNLILKLRRHHNPQFKESDVDSFGLLRLVDKLQVSETGENFKELIVYLFQNSIVLISPSYSHMLTYGIPDSPMLKTPNSSTLRVSFVGGASLYITHESNKVLQKWIAALCDYDFVFNSDDLSSTVRFDGEELRNDGVNDDDEDEDDDDDGDYSLGNNDTYGSLSSKSISEEDDEEDQMALPVLLSPMNFKGGDKEVVETDDETPIVEKLPDFARFQKRDKLILVIDHTKLINGESLMILKNIAKVLSMRFKEFNLIYSNDFERVLKIGDVEAIDTIGVHSSSDDTTSINDTINSIKAANSNNPEDYSLLIITNSIISNASLRQLPILNQLVINVQNYGITTTIKASPFGEEAPVPVLKGDDIFKVPSWDKIMEVLINRLELDFSAMAQSGGGDDDDDEYDSDSFDSDDLESSFDSDAVESDNDNDVVVAIATDAAVATSDGKDDVSDGEETYFDEYKGVPVPAAGTEEEGEGGVEVEVEVSPISSDSNHVNANKDCVKKKPESSGRWTVLFKDIDDALLETTLRSNS